MTDDNRTTLVYKYALPFGPETEEQVRLLDDHIHRAHRYYNQMIELKRAMADAIRWYQKQIVPELAEVWQKVDDFYACARQAEDPEQKKDFIKRAEAEKKTANKILDEAKKGEVGKQLSESEKIVKERYKVLQKSVQAPKNSGLHNGTYNLINDAVKKTKWYPSFKRAEGGLAKRGGEFKWVKSGSVGTQIISSHGRLFSEGLLEGTHKQLKILPQDGETNDRYKKLVFQIDTDEKKQPIYLEFKMVYHRPLPEGAEIKRATIHRYREGKKWKYYVCFTLNIEKGVVGNHPSTESCAIDMGHRYAPNEEDHGYNVRYAYWSDTMDHQGEMLLPKSSHRKNCSIHERMDYVDAIASRRRLLFDQAKKDIVEWCKKTEARPPWLLEKVSKVKTERRLVELFYRWKKERVEGDEKGFETLAKWRKTEEHLYPIQEDYRGRTLRHRRDHYYKLAHRLCRKYSTIVIENLKLDKMSERNKTRKEKGKKEQDDLAKSARRNRTRVAISEFFNILGWVAKKYGTQITRVNPRNTSKTCHVCTKVTQLASEPRYQCEHCGAEWDRDYNATRNILQSASIEMTRKPRGSLAS